jgi:hypothetical protein
MCPSSGVIVLSSISGGDTNFTAVRNSLPTKAFSNNQLSVGPLSTAVGSTNLVATFTVTTDSVLTFDVTTTQPVVSLSFQIVQKQVCTTQTLRCNRNGYPCEQITSTLTAGDYYMLIQDTSNPAPPAGNYSFNITYIYGSSACRNITDQLNFCKDHLSTSDKFKLTSQIAVDTVEANAMTDYATLSASWDVTKCNNSLIDFACKSNFQLSKCEDNGQTTTTYLCKEDCLNTLQPACLATNENPNNCEDAACEAAVRSINQCRNPPPPPGNSGMRLHLGLIFYVLTIFLLGIFNN